MFPNSGTNIPATKKTRKTKKTAGLSNQTYLISGFGRVSGFGAEDRWFSGCGGWSVLLIWGFCLGKKWGGWVWGFGGTKPRGVDRVRMGNLCYGMGCKEIIKGCI